MPLINPDSSSKKATITVKISIATKSDIEAYVKWAKLKNTSEFVEKAAMLILSKDKEWKKHKNSV